MLLVPIEYDNPPRIVQKKSKKSDKDAVLGEGTYGEVFLAIQNGVQYAVKRLKNIDTNVPGLREPHYVEIAAANLFKHDNVVNTESIYIKDKQIHLVMEYCSSNAKKLFDTRMSIMERRCAYRQCLSGLAYLHQQGFIHRDIKPDNILVQFKPTATSFVNQTLFKIGDFGLGVFANSTSQGSYAKPHPTYHWTDGYRPPEVIIGWYDVGHVADVWSLGVTFLELVCGKNVFAQSSSIVKQYEDQFGISFKNYQKSFVDDQIVIEATYDFLNIPLIEEEERDFLRLMLEIDPRKRYSAAQLLQHDFLCNLDDEVMQKVGQGQLGELMPLSGTQFQE